MNCPACHNPMVALELAGVEIDHCLSCKGTWLDAGELDLLLEGSEGSRAFLSSFAPDEGGSEKPRKCPICDKRMEKILCGAEGGVRIDRCRRGDGLWLDKGELRRILEEACFGGDRRVLDLLNEMFAEKGP